MTKQINQIDQLKSLSGSIAHEMRNPLGAINQCAKLIIEGLNDSKEKNADKIIIDKSAFDEALNFLNLIDSSSFRGLSLIDIILNNIHDKKPNKTDFEEILISDVINCAIKEYPFEKNQRDLVKINLNQDFTFKGNKDSTVFIIFNLLKNSLHYSGQEISIRLENKNNQNLLYFKDSGSGIPSDKLSSIFESFMTSDKKNGTGLGLPFCKRAMKAFGGDIVCNSQEGEGAEFILYFPVIV